MRKTIAVATALILGGAGAIGVTVPAFAHDKAFNVQCDYISINLTNYPDGSTIHGTIDGSDLGTAAFGGSRGNYSTKINLDPYVVHSYSVDVISGDHQPQFNFSAAGNTTACELPAPPVTEPPVTTPPTDEPTVPPTDTPTEPPVTTPPTDEPTEPPVTIPPTEEPTSPPTTAPPTEEPTPPVTTAPPVTQEPTPTPTTDAPQVPTSEPTPKADKPEKPAPKTLTEVKTEDSGKLAYTGTDETQRNIGLIGGFVLLLAGIAIALTSRIRSRKEVQ